MSVWIRRIVKWYEPQGIPIAIGTGLEFRCKHRGIYPCTPPPSGVCHMYLTTKEYEGFHKGTQSIIIGCQLLSVPS